jgi:hypothetical protein
MGAPQLLLLSVCVDVADGVAYEADDLPLAHIIRASEAHTVNHVLLEGHDAKVCFGDGGRGYLYRQPLENTRLPP